MKRKVLISVCLALVMLLLVTIAVAAIPDPDASDLITGVNSYQNVLELGDQLYLVLYKLSYNATAQPAIPANETFLIMHVNNSTNVTNAAVGPFAFNEDGYQEGLASIYFSAATAPAWGGNYSIRVIGNPGQPWDAGDPPLTIMDRTSFSNETSGNTTAITQSAISSRIQVIANILEIDWDGVFDLMESVGGSNKFTGDGENYFTNVINNLINIAPELFSARSFVPTFQDRQYGYIYSDNLSGQLLGTNWDMSVLAANFGTERMWMSGVFFMIGVMFIIYRSIRVGQGFGHAFMLFYMFLPFGARMGFLPLVVPVVAMFIFGGLPVVWYFAHRQTA